MGLLGLPVLRECSWMRARCDAQEAEAASFDAQRKLQEQVHELQAKQQALQGDIGAQVRACIMHSQS